MNIVVIKGSLHSFGCCITFVNTVFYLQAEAHLPSQCQDPKSVLHMSRVNASVLHLCKFTDSDLPSVFNSFQLSVQWLSMIIFKPVWFLVGIVSSY